jgi:hypothetical protein
LRQRIAEQKLSLNDLIGLLDSYTVDDPRLTGVKADLNALQALFAEIVIATPEATVSEENGVATIGGGGPAATLNDAQLTAIRDRTAAIRNSYIN